MQIIKKANPNRHGVMFLEKDEYGVFWITGPQDGEFETDPDDAGTDEAEAIKKFDRAVSYWAEKPNWRAQAAYDEEHGTINGYAEWQYESREF